MSLINLTNNFTKTTWFFLISVHRRSIQFFDWFRNTRFGRKFLDILYDTTVLISYLGAFALIHKVQEKWLGDYLIFGKYRFEYIIHVGHLMALGLFFLEIAKTGVEILRDIIRIVLATYADVRNVGSTGNLND